MRPRNANLRLKPLSECWVKGYLNGSKEVYQPQNSGVFERYEKGRRLGSRTEEKVPIRKEKERRIGSRVEGRTEETLVEGGTPTRTGQVEYSGERDDL